jgi:predicted Zn-dependent protease
LGNVLTGPTYVAYPGLATYGLYDYFPSWGVSHYASWGLGSVASNYLYSGYTNPYFATGAATPAVANTTVVYDYAQPINVASAPPEASVAESTEQVFSAARDSFKAGDFPRALELTDQVLKQTPNVPVVHEFRALILFAQKRYDEAAVVNYAVLSAGPGWNWSTLVGLYPDVESYTNQLRALEAFVKSNPNSTSGRFLLGYHYMVQGHKEQAGTQFEKVVALEPKDQLSASFAKALKKVSEAATALATAATPTAGGQAQAQPQPQPQPQPAAAGDAPAEAASPEDAPPPPPPPARLVGTWKAQPAKDVVIDLTLKEDGVFTWVVDTKGEKQSITGQAGFKDGVLALLQPEGPPLAGKVTEDGPNTFKFKPPGAPENVPGLTFNRGA